MSKTNPDQFDFFYEPVYPVRVNEPVIDSERFHSELARALSRAMDACPKDRFEIANDMAKALGQDDFSKAMLDAYASESKDTHNISLVRFIAFIKATGQDWLMDFLAKQVGAICLVGEEPKLAEAARLSAEIKALQKKQRELTASPVRLKRRKRS